MKQYTLRRRIDLNDFYDIIIVGEVRQDVQRLLPLHVTDLKCCWLRRQGHWGNGYGRYGSRLVLFSDGEKIIYRGIAEKIFTEARKEYLTKQKMRWLG